MNTCQPFLHTYKEFYQKTADASVISFDFFDTLFIRTVLDPEDVFDILGKQHGIDNFRILRKEAQTKAFRRMHQQGRKEITLTDIYQCFEQCPIPAEKLMQWEYDLELRLVHPNVETVPAFYEAVHSGKNVIIISDMYLPASFFLDALRRHSLPTVPVFISSDMNATKRDSGELFDLVVEQLDLEHHAILHIGDNPLSDIQRAEEKGLVTLHYTEQRRPPTIKQSSPEVSLARGLFRLHTRTLKPHSAQELGFLYGGPAITGFLDWLAEQVTDDRCDHILFLARDGYHVYTTAQAHKPDLMNSAHYFNGSRTLFSLAAMTEKNFSSFLPFLISGCGELSPYELLTRIGVHPPAEQVMKELGFGSDVMITPSLMDKMKRFLYAYRQQILRICHRNRRALFSYLVSLGIEPGDTVALVDIGWSGSTQRAFETALQLLFEVRVNGYYFCLSNTQECRQNQQRQRMVSFISEANTPEEMIRSIYTNRVGAELFFSAPHPSVIGLERTNDGMVSPVYNTQNRYSTLLESFNHELAEGIQLFCDSYNECSRMIRIPHSPFELAKPLIEFITHPEWLSHPVLNELKDFDDWSKTKNTTRSMNHYRDYAPDHS